MYLGKQVRLEGILNRTTGRTIIVPMDRYGVTMGLVDGLYRHARGRQRHGQGRR